MASKTACYPGYTILLEKYRLLGSGIKVKAQANGKLTIEPPSINPGKHALFTCLGIQGGEFQGLNNTFVIPNYVYNMHKHN